MMEEETIDSSSVLQQEFEAWQEVSPSDNIFLLETNVAEDGRTVINLLLGCEHEIKLTCPLNYPAHDKHFFVVGPKRVSTWLDNMNECFMKSKKALSFKEVLSKAEEFYKAVEKYESDSSDLVDEEDSSETKYDDCDNSMMADDDMFTTDKELRIDRKKKRWAQKEAFIREQMKKARMSSSKHNIDKYRTPNHVCVNKGPGDDMKKSGQIFTSTAAAGILTNDLVKILENEEQGNFSVEPVEDNIYRWRVKLFNFDKESDLHDDLRNVRGLFGYDYIELEMTFEIDLYPFYPPLVKVVRPRLQSSLMQRVTNMELLKLSFWNPTKDMTSVIQEIKEFLQTWARLEVDHERNDKKRYPSGSYLEMEHHLLTLALVSEINPRVNLKYIADLSGMSDNNASSSNHCLSMPQRKEYWAKGVGFGHHLRPEWDINAYVAAQNEKDRQVELVLQQIIYELKRLYTEHAPQLKPKGSAEPVRNGSDHIDPVEDMFSVLEGSALVPFIEQYLQTQSLLEVSRHMNVYKLIIEIIREISKQSGLLPLLCALSDQKCSLYCLLEKLETQAALVLSHIHKIGNGNIPSATTPCDHDFEKIIILGEAPEPEKSDSDFLAEEKFSREIVTLFSFIKESLKANSLLDRVVHENQSNGIEENSFPSLQPSSSSSSPTPSSTPTSSTTSNVGCVIPCLLRDDFINYLFSKTSNDPSTLETQYKTCMKDLQFKVTEICQHHFAKGKHTDDRKVMNQSQVVRIAQELTSLQSSLPLELSSSIFVRSDEERMTLLKVLVTGPEGTPYTGGCFIFDICFPSLYPKVPPVVNFQTTGNGSVRFNPNLYHCGKVCLSLLGTWAGQTGENWNEKTSTLLQVLISIQSLILVAEPYFNEPGYEQEIGTECGKKHSEEYNENVWINNIKHAIISHIQFPPEEFKDVIENHFCLKKDKIIQEVNDWLEKHPSKKLQKLADDLHTIFKGLKTPPSLQSRS